MKRLVYFLIIMSILMFACNISLPSTPPVVTTPTIVSAPTGVSPTLADTPIPAATVPPITTNVTCNNLSFYLDPALASGFNCETVPENTQGMEVNPQYTDLTLQGYILSDKFFPAHIAVYPVQDFTNILPDFIPSRVTDLQTLIGGGPAPVFTTSFSTSLPFLPVFNAAQVFFARYQSIPFVSGSGIRFLTEFAQYSAPVNNYDLFYTYQGLTYDGQYWVSAILPINNPILPVNADSVLSGANQDEFNANFESYITDMVIQLNSQTPESYGPTLTALDALVSSITIQP